MMAFLVVVVILQEIGIDVRALLVSAGVVGVAIGLGAQSLIRDVIMGFFILLENLIAVGDVIEVGPHTGVVESVGLRVTKIRKFSGELRIIPNGELTAFGHHTAGWARLVVEVVDRLRGGRGPGAPGAGRGRQGPGGGAPRDGPGAADRGGHPAVRPERHDRGGPASARPRRRAREGRARVRGPPAREGGLRRAWHPGPARCHGGPPRPAVRRGSGTAEAKTPERSRSHEGPHRRVPRRGSRHPLPARDEGPAQGDAPPRRQAHDPVRRRGGGGRRARPRQHRDRARQARHRGPLRLGRRAGVLPAGAGEVGGAGPDQDDLGPGVGVLRPTEGAARPGPRHPVRAAPRGRRAVRRLPRRRHHRVRPAVHRPAPGRVRAARRPRPRREAGAQRRSCRDTA